MRVTGAGDPRQVVQDTLVGKLPQRKLRPVQPPGYSSYGNQIGLATGEVKEYYNPDSSPSEWKSVPSSGLLRGRMSFVKNPFPAISSSSSAARPAATAAAVLRALRRNIPLNRWKPAGLKSRRNALTERKIQRMFRRQEVTTLIKRCNDFGAGGVSVAIGELTDGLDINLDKVLRNTKASTERIGHF